MQENAGITKATRNIQSQMMIMRALVSGGASGFGSSKLVSLNALNRVSSVDHFYRAQVIERRAREIFPFPTPTWSDLANINNLVGPATENASELERDKAAIIVSLLS